MRFSAMIFTGLFTFSAQASSYYPEGRTMGLTTEFISATPGNQVFTATGRPVIDVNPFGETSKMICDLLLSPPPMRRIIGYGLKPNLHTVFGLLHADRLVLTQEFEMLGLPTQYGHVRINLPYGNLTLFSSPQHSDHWHDELPLGERNLTSEFFEVTGRLTKFVPDFLATLASLETRIPYEPRAFQAAGKMVAGEEFDLQSLETRTTFNRQNGMGVSTQDFVLVTGELTKTRFGYAVITSAGSVHRLDAESVPFVGSDQPLNLLGMVNRQVVAQGLRGEKGLRVHSRSNSIGFVRPL